MVGVERGPAPCEFLYSHGYLKRHSSWPLSASQQTAASSWPSWRRQYARPPATARLEYPAPAFLASHNCFGPFSGQEVSKPVSPDRPSRLGPRHCGQSPETALSTCSCERSAWANFSNSTG